MHSTLGTLTRATHTPSQRHVSDPIQPARSHTSPEQLSTKSYESGPRGKTRLNTLHTFEYEPASSSAHPLQAEIDRLTAACEVHERKIRAAKATIEHRLFLEWPQAFTRLSDIDDQADQMTTQIHAALQSTIPAHQSRLDNILEARQADARHVKDRTTPWRAFFARQNGEERERAKSQEGDGAPGRIHRVEGTLTETDGLSQIERWAEEVTIYLSAEIIRLRSQLNAMSWRRRLLVRLVFLGIGFLVLLIVVGWATWIPPSAHASKTHRTAIDHY